MKTQTQLVNYCTLILALVVPYGWAADEAEYNSSTRILTIPTVKVDSQYVYDARLQLDNNGLFSILSYSNTASDSASSDFVLASSAIENGELLDAYKCETKENDIEKSIPLSWSNIPTGTGALAVIMHHFPNPDDTSQANSYLLLWDIAPSVTAIPYGEADDGPWYMGANKDGTAISYTSPCSPSSGSLMRYWNNLIY